jgi:hypothetical protein
MFDLTYTDYVTDIYNYLKSNVIFPNNYQVCNNIGKIYAIKILINVIRKLDQFSFNSLI